MSLGFWEIAIIALVILVFFGPSRLPGLGKALGASIRGLKQGLKEGVDESEQAAKTEAEKLAEGRTSQGGIKSKTSETDKA